MERDYLFGLGIDLVKQSLDHEEDFAVWLRCALSEGDLGKQFPSLCQRLAEVACSWRQRFDPPLWARLARDKCSTLIKEAREAVPVIDFVIRHLGELGEAHGQVTIVDLCSGLGFLGMFLSELLPPERVHVCLLLDQAWPLKGENQPSEYSPGRRGRTRLNWDHIYQLAWPIPLVTRRCDLKLPSTHAQILSRLLEPAPGPVFLLGIHLCGVLSIRAIETFNRGPKCVGFVLKPCCLPSMHYARQQVSWTLGSHTFAAAEVCCWGRYRQNRWTGPVKATLGPRFRCWAEHLHRGIPWTSKAISRVELVEGHYQDEAWPLPVTKPETDVTSDHDHSSVRLTTTSATSL
ncbi:unnamed protein product [Durusdinium trenchii]|uniref:Methyltransferase domain-containing protein n=1 Tax=Durusdinium trenchii TaxID=1381693 RepID=A0ABP0PHY3_9DINO